MFEIHFMPVLPGTTVNTKTDHIERFESQDEAWRFIFTSWAGCKHTILDMREVVDGVTIRIYDYPAIESAVYSQRL